MINILKDWQELISGILALVAGAFIFLQGRLERRAIERARADDSEKETARTRRILERLDQACSDLQDQVDRVFEILEDVLSAIDRGDRGIQLPSRIVIPKIFEVIFAQLTTQEISIRVYIELSLLLERGTALDEDFRRFLVSYGPTVTEHPSAQPRLPLIGVDGRRTAEDPAAQTLLISTRSLHEVIVELRLRIKEDLDGGTDGSNIRSSDRRLVAMQPIEIPAGDRQEDA